VLGLPRPDLERVGVAIAKARAYKATLTDTKQVKQAVAKAHPKARYIGLLPEIDPVDALDAQISRYHQERGMPLRDFWLGVAQDAEGSARPRHAHPTRDDRGQ
jgi:hypothetical protein